MFNSVIWPFWLGTYVRTSMTNHIILHGRYRYLIKRRSVYYLNPMMLPDHRALITMKLSQYL